MITLRRYNYGNQLNTLNIPHCNNYFKQVFFLLSEIQALSLVCIEDIDLTKEVTNMEVGYKFYMNHGAIDMIKPSN